MKLSGVQVRIYLLAVLLFNFTSKAGLHGSSLLTEDIQDTLKSANNPIQPVYFTTRLSTARPVIDGKLDDDCWKRGNWAGDFHQFRSNFVAKWEYRLGSFVYFVWSSERTGQNDMSGVSLAESYKQLKDVFPNNIFLIKLNYWFSL